MKNEQGSDETERKSAKAVTVCCWTLFIFSVLVLSTDHFLQDSKKNERTGRSDSRKGLSSSHSVHHLFIIRICIMISTFFLFIVLLLTTSFFLASSCLSNLICAMILFKQGVDHILQTTRKLQMLRLDKKYFN